MGTLWNGRLLSADIGADEASSGGNKEEDHLDIDFHPN
jgi:hypothetical protein